MPLFITLIGVNKVIITSMKNDKIYWYRKPDGTLVDESPDNAWKVHNQNVRFRGFKYLGWSTGSHIKSLAFKSKKTAVGVYKQATADEKQKIQEAIDLELEEAKNNQQIPKAERLKELVGGAHGQITSPRTPGILSKVQQ